MSSFQQELWDIYLFRYICYDCYIFVYNYVIYIEPRKLLRSQVTTICSGKYDDNDARTRCIAFMSQTEMTNCQGGNRSESFKDNTISLFK